jgi:hypothetical protein
MVRLKANREICGWAEIASTIAQEDRHGPGRIGGDEVLVAVTVEIARRDPNRRGGGKESGIAEIPASAEQDLHAVREPAGNSEILLAVTIEITQDYAHRITARIEECRRPELASPVAQQNRYTARSTIVNNDEVLLAVAIEIADHDRVRC